MAMGNAPTGTAPAPFPTAAAAGPAASGATVAATPAAGRGALPKASDEASDEETAIGKPSDELLSASGAGAAAQADPLQEWRVVYEDFLRTKRECGEPTDGLTFEKFQQTLKKNRDALMQRHGCKRVKFSVYVKEGRASLKATPVRE